MGGQGWTQAICLGPVSKPRASCCDYFNGEIRWWLAADCYTIRENGRYGSGGGGSGKERLENRPSAATGLLKRARLPWQSGGAMRNREIKMDEIGSRGFIDGLAQGPGPVEALVQGGLQRYRR
ncbi:uncharacterized protein TRIREDRAFT_104157 [Trichoderma reesei QM6a]|uniref:Predicted protein n=2 Tax=Hypocrea jecorina TaxID=51453 RepID=G0RBL4_HYPJQ|nr:uncharacterized protein TRIREDRAFT_104157 [Trichoderma reesei QM6a]EGR51348.1 predicted protein [Trichoderma reesei QM6a]ETS04781.1 hypothetical protein M419DRAFT_73275 [Trichoderma reesei RUT C-30]